MIDRQKDSKIQKKDEKYSLNWFSEYNSVVKITNKCLRNALQIYEINMHTGAF